VVTKCWKSLSILNRPYRPFSVMVTNLKLFCTHLNYLTKFLILLNCRLKNEVSKANFNAYKIIITVIIIIILIIILILITKLIAIYVKGLYGEVYGTELIQGNRYRKTR